VSLNACLPLQAEQKLKLEAFARLEALRNDFRWEEYFERNDDKQSMAAYWKKRFQEASSQLNATTVRPGPRRAPRARQPATALSLSCATLSVSVSVG